MELLQGRAVHQSCSEPRPLDTSDRMKPELDWRSADSLKAIDHGGRLHIAEGIDCQVQTFDLIRAEPFDRCCVVDQSRGRLLPHEHSEHELHFVPDALR
jgi:hypothetical protein